MRTQVIGHFLAGGFVILKKVITKSSALVKSDGEVIGLVLFEDFDQGAGKTKNTRGGFAFGCGKAGCATAGEREIITIGDGVSVQQIEHFGHFYLRVTALLMT